MDNNEKTFLEKFGIGLDLVLKIVLVIFFTLLIEGMLSAQSRIRDKATESSISGTEVIGVDRTDYTSIKKISTLSLRNYVIGGLSIHNSTIAGFNTSGWLEGQVLKFNSSGVLVPANDATGGTGGGAEYLNDLLDVSTVGVTTNQFLKYNGTSWQPFTANLESIRALGNSFDGSVYFEDNTYFSGILQISEQFKIPYNAASGKVLTSDASGYVTWQYPTVRSLIAGNGIRLDAGGSTGQIEINMAPVALPSVTSPIASNISFAIDYAGDERKLSFQQASTLLMSEQVYMSLYPETSIVISDDVSTLDLCGIEVTLANGEGSTIPIITGDQTDFTLVGNYCTPYFDDIDNNKYKFCIYQFTTLPVGEDYHVTVTHTPSGASQVWHLQIWGGPGGGGGIGVGLDGDDIVTAIPDKSLGTEKINDEAITLSQLDSDVQAQLVYFVTSWPTTATQGLYFKLGEGLRYYYLQQGSCAFGFQTFDGLSGACINSR